MSSSTLRMLRESVRRLNFKLYLALVFRLLIPTFYKTFRVAILGSLPDTGSVSIASQMTWVNVLLEIVEEGLLQPLYHCLGATVADGTQARAFTC